MSTVLFFSFIGSLLICMALIPALTASAWRFQFIDVPRDRRMHAEPIAKVGGIALGAGTIAAVLLWAPQDRMILASLLGGVVILLFGIWDDRVGLDHRMKFAGQILAAAIVVAYAGVRVTAIPFVDDQALPLWAAATITMVIIVGMTNAVNLADGLDGLAGGLSLISFTGITYLAYQANDQMLMVLMVSVLGSLLGFLRFNTYPARVFMGDAGSQFLGHYLAVAAILLIDPARAPYSPLLVLFLWGIPLLDTVGVMGQRLWQGRSPFVGDRNHLHHKLLAMGLSHRQAVTVIYLAQGLSVLCAVVLRWQSDAMLLGVYAVFATAVLSVFVWSSWRSASPTPAAVPSGEAPAAGVAPDAMRAWPLQGLTLFVPLYLLACLATPGKIPAEVGLIAAGLAAVVLGSLVIARGTAFAVRVGLYIGSTCAVYYAQMSSRQSPAEWLSPLTLGGAALAVLVVLTIRWMGDARFQTTPLDYLIVFLAVVMPFLSDLTVGAVQLSVVTATLIVLFFAFELLLQMHQAMVTRLGWLTAAMLGGLAVRVWWA
ncbi:glycosyltransferase family 4 protein [Nitrospira lenta]|uniref:Putative Undecaprenyl-phosphate alpha-N-acetylglucosaminyl 1-phosphate transferase (Modular protein) n=1 Tax=Nitrospira lenta TaxID=1436998 RepID=A0A330L016_9BACT|nr:MraY family glycosyltransferase [Nitrospira lenta]SPP62984.1 putative Undecaprenyl-phosphate alpha-N-acetylglucosaminyl 1-phosphate transferase (Modular protein) [Nitrospira lenta]